MSTDISREAAEILPCPFCGGTKTGEDFVSNTGGNVRYRYCRTCYARGPWGNHSNKNEKWNTRSDRATAALREERDTLRRQLDDYRDDADRANTYICTLANLIPCMDGDDTPDVAIRRIKDERDELRAENERLRQQLNSANQQHQL